MKNHYLYTRINHRHMKLYTSYFSATHTTKSIVTKLTRELGIPTQSFDITSRPITEEIMLPSDAVLLIGMPVYGGRIPHVAVKSLQQFKGSHTPVILVAVYGNREVEDALVEMQDIMEANGCYVMAAATFIAQHSIFPHTAKGRPDSSDQLKISEFALRCKKILEQGVPADAQSISLPGNRPYKTPGDIPLKIVTSSACVECNTCIKVCPVGAIPLDNPHVTDYDKCIHCGRCIYYCGEHARHYGGLLFKLAGAAFGWKNRKRKEPQFFF